MVINMEAIRNKERRSSMEVIGNNQVKHVSMETINLEEDEEVDVVMVLSCVKTIEERSIIVKVLVEY